MLKLINIKRIVFIVLIIALLFLGAITFISFGVGVLIIALCHFIFTLSYENNRIAELFLGTKLSDIHKENLKRVGSSPVFIITLIITNLMFFGVAIYALIVVKGFNLINIIH